MHTQTQTHVNARVLIHYMYVLEMLNTHARTHTHIIKEPGYEANFSP